jgi:hypothetical protein
MSVTLFYDPFLLYGPYDLSADHTEVRLDQKIDVKEVTRFGHDTHIFRPGLNMMEVAGRGWVQFDDLATPKAVDYNLFNEIKATEKVFTLTPTKADNEVAYLFRGVADAYAFDLNVQNVGSFDFSVKSASNKCVRGRLLLPLASRVATGNGTINNNLGAVGATQKLVGGLHVTAFNGTSLVMRIKSNTSAIVGGATTRMTFTTAAGVTSEYQEVSGPITDTFWYADWTLVGTSFSAAVSAGIR